MQDFKTKLDYHRSNFFKPSHYSNFKSSLKKSYQNCLFYLLLFLILFFCLHLIRFDKLYGFIQFENFNNELSSLKNENLELLEIIKKRDRQVKALEQIYEKHASSQPRDLGHSNPKNGIPKWDKKLRKYSFSLYIRPNRKV